MYLPWWGVVLAAVGVLLGLALFVRYTLDRLVAGLLTLPSKAKGAVLQGARAEVHSVEPAEPPPTHAPEEADPVGSRGGAKIGLRTSRST